MPPKFVIPGAFDVIEAHCAFSFTIFYLFYNQIILSLNQI